MEDRNYKNNNSILREANTVAAREYAFDLSHDRDDVNSKWWELYSNYRLSKWRNELKSLSQKTGISFEYVCDYIGSEFSSTPGFYRKLPKNRTTYIAIGMAYKCSLQVINEWLVKYAAKQKLYAKDILNDLVWEYLIICNEKDHHSNINYFKKYEKCRADIEELYLKLWNINIGENKNTITLEERLKSIRFDQENAALINFVAGNIDAFKTAYIKPRCFLNMYVTKILATKNSSNSSERKVTLNSLRGYLDDSMINYLAGSYETINVKSSAHGERTSNMKAVPKNKRAHISLGLALGMTLEDLDKYLVMMGYAPLDGTQTEEGELINLLRKWEIKHPTQRKYKLKYIHGDDSIVITKEEASNAVGEMLQLRQDLKFEYESSQTKYGSKGPVLKSFKKFPYMKD